MKNINELFENVDKATKKEVFKKYGLSISDTILFSDENVVIGINGSGKTRFLKAIRELYHLNNQKNIVYGYFPDLSPKKIDKVYTDGNLPEATLYETLQDGEIEFDDFLREIENQNDSYISDLLNYHSVVQKQKSEKAMSSFSSTFLKLTNYEIVIDNKEVYLKLENEITPLNIIINSFSPGQLMIFYLSIFISLHGNKKQIIILDEPECHLHPNALLGFIRTLKECKCYSSLWIATHSLFSIPEFDFENIVYIDKGIIHQRGSVLYDNILSDMIGKNYYESTLFLSSLEHWEFSHFLAECFTNPIVVDRANPVDEQVLLFIEFLEKHKTLKVLDFGGGSARLGRSLKLSDYKNKDKIIYNIYDKKISDRAKDFVCYDNLDNIPDSYYDCVVLMNVLHEVDPTEWVQLFNSIHSKMAANSYLLFVETSVLGKGELPNDIGFLVLGNHELQKLFNLKTNLPEIRIKDKQKSICIAIRSSELLNINEETVYRAIKTLEDNSFKALKKERASKKSSRKYAFYTQQYINAKLFVDEYKKSKSKNGEVSIIDSEQSLKEHRFEINNKRCQDLFQNNNYVIKKVDLANHILAWLKQVKSNNIYERMSCDVLKDILLKYTKGNLTTKSSLEELWDKALILENNFLNRNLISLSLLTLGFLGHQKAKNRFLENNYAEYLPFDL